MQQVQELQVHAQIAWRRHLKDTAMKIRIRELREIVGRLIAEAACTACGDPNAYVGLNSCECPNPKCEFFSQRQADDVRPKATTPAKKKPNIHYCGSPLSLDGYCQKCDGPEPDSMCPSCYGAGTEWDDYGGNRPCKSCNGVGYDA